MSRPGDVSRQGDLCLEIDLHHTSTKGHRPLSQLFDTSPHPGKNTPSFRNRRNAGRAVLLSEAPSTNDSIVAGDSTGLPFGSLIGRLIPVDLIIGGSAASRSSSVMALDPWLRCCSRSQNLGFQLELGREEGGESDS